MKVLARVACVVIAIAALFLSYQPAGDLYLTGFADGHLTDYDKAVDTPKHILMWLELGFVALFLFLAFFRFSARARAVGLLAALTVFVIVVLVQLVGSPWYFGSHLGLENGIGG
jgi:Na+/proline symporter